jgi:chitinase
MSARLVVYFNDNTRPFSTVAQTPYTDIIVGFLVPSAPNNLTLKIDAGEPSNFAGEVKALQQKGKRVLVSFGGESVTSAEYQQYAKEVPQLVQQLVGFVTRNGLNGVDIDYEDDTGFTGAYDGVKFLSELTAGLAQHLPAGHNIITHAPQPPYFSPTFEGGPYDKLWKEAGRHITWINCQFYNNQDFDGTAALKVQWYEKIAAITGPNKLMMGSLIGDVGEGFLPLTQLVSGVVNPLTAKFGKAFGGVMGFQFSLDKDATWGEVIASQVLDTHIPE